MGKILTKTVLLLVVLTFCTTNALAIADGTYFVKTDDGRFWMRGEPYGSAVQLYDWGLPVVVSTSSGVTTLKFADASDWIIFDDGQGLYADNPNPDNKTWTVTEANGKYTFKNSVNNRYARVDGSRVMSSANAADAYAFTLVSASDHQAALAHFVNTQASAAAAAGGITVATADELEAMAATLNQTVVKAGATAATTAEKFQGGQWDSRTVYSSSVNITTPGLYKFTMQAFYRLTDNETTYDLHTRGFDCPPVNVFFGDAKTPIASVYSESNSVNNNCYTAPDGKFYPNGQTGALAAFRENHYVNTVWAYIASPGTYNFGIQYLGWAGSHAEWTCYTTESTTVTLYTQDWWAPLQAALANYAPYDDIAAADDATGYTAQYAIFTAYTQTTPQADMAAAITYMKDNYAAYQWAHASVAHPVDVTAGIVNDADCTDNNAWYIGLSGRSTESAQDETGATRTLFTQNVEPNPVRGQTVTIPQAGAYMLKTWVRTSDNNAGTYAKIAVSDGSYQATGTYDNAEDIAAVYGNESTAWRQVENYFATSAANQQKTIYLNMSHGGSGRKAFVSRLSLYYIGQSADFVKDGVHRYIGSFAEAPSIELTDEVPVANTAAAVMNGASVMFTNPNGLVYAASGQVSNPKNVIVGGTCANLELTDGHPFVCPTAFTATNAKYTLGSSYVATDGNGQRLATLVLPFTATKPAGATAYAIETADVMSEALNGVEVSGAIEAGRPVLVTASGEYTASGVNVIAVAVGATFENGQLVGSFGGLQAPQNSYVLQKHQDQVAFYLVGNSPRPQVGPFRAYIKAQGSQARQLRLVVGESLSVQGVDALPQQAGQTFDLQGRQQSFGSRSGVVIVRQADGTVRKLMK